jgi:hypothetical protein
MIYFIKRPDNGLIKIGTTVCLSERLKQLRYEVSANIRVLAIMDGSYPEESNLHHRFVHLRVGESVLCEWFNPGSDLLKFIAIEGRRWKPEDDEPVLRKPMVAQIRCGAEWKAWIEEMAEKEGDTVAKLLDRAIRKYAKDSGFPDPPRR